MNRMETKIIIMVTNRLAEAKDSEAKTEMIEELSENLYQRYLELAESGMPEEEALQKAVESLGDVEELLAYLEDTEKEEDPKETILEFQEEKESQKESFSYSTDDPENGFSFSTDDMENGIGKIVSAAFSTARAAMDCAKDVAKDVSEQLREKYPEGTFRQFTVRTGKKVDCTAIPLENVHSLEIHLTNGSVDLMCTDRKEGFIEVEGDTDEIETMLKDDGVLLINQENTASAAYFFMRGMRRSDLTVRLPEKLWEQVIISTINGDVSIRRGMNGKELRVTTASGDVELAETAFDRMDLRATSGDIEGRGLNGILRAETKSGDIELEGSCGRCELFSASGDICFSGVSKEINCTSTSGDVELDLENLPEKLTGSSISGDCDIRVPAEQGFRISYKTVSGDFDTNLSLSGKVGKKSGEAVFGDECCGELRVSSVSGDISIWTVK